MKRKAFQFGFFVMSGFWFISAIIYSFNDTSQFSEKWFYRVFLSTICVGIAALLEDRNEK